MAVYESRGESVVDPQPLVLATLRGGLNDVDPPQSLPDDQCPVSFNMDYERSTLGGRRRGRVPLTTSGFLDATTFLHRHLPTVNETESQLWALSVNNANTSNVWRYKDTSW